MVYIKWYYNEIKPFWTILFFLQKTNFYFIFKAVFLYAYEMNGTT